MTLNVARVDDDRGWREFLALPRRLYAHDPAWIPALDREVRRTLDDRLNPYFRTARLARWICRRHDRSIARCVTVIHPSYMKNPDRRPALFGFFESENDPEGARALFEAAADDARMMGATHLIGPFQPHHYSELGLQVDGFDTAPTFFQTHHLPYYRDLLERMGFEVERTLHTRRNADIRSWLASHPAPAVSAPGLRVRPVNLADLDNELERIREVYNDAFEPNCYFVPVSREEYRFAASGLRLVTRPDLNVIVEHGTEPVGVLQCMLDINPLLRPFRSGRLTPGGVLRFITGRRRIRRLVVYAVGIKRQWQRGRVHALLFAALHRMAEDFDELETTWMSPGNPISIRAADRFGMREDKHFVIMKKAISERRTT